jgi:hypothetical protein
LAVSSIYAVDFSINVGKWNCEGKLDEANNMTVQACCRSLIVDTLPIPLQQAGSAWGMSFLSGLLENTLTVKQLAECALLVS